MRYLLVCALLVGAMLAGLAQADTTLKLSRSLVTIKLTDPARQLTVFAPVIDLIDGLVPAKEGVPPPSKQLADGVGKLTGTPGVKATGEFLVAIMPPPPAPTAPPPAAPTPEQPAPAVTPPSPAFLLVPLADAAAFKAALAVADLHEIGHVQVVGDTAVVALDKQQKAPVFTEISRDLTLITSREIAISVQMQNAPSPAESPALGPMVAMLGPIFDILTDVQKNMQRAEIGIAMVGDTLSVETYTIPVPGSPLATSLATAKPSSIPIDYAAYLPENTAYCEASGPMLPGSPGGGNLIFRMAMGMLGSFLTPEQQKPFTASVDRLIQQCAQGRVIGVTTPPADSTTPPALVAIYHITSEQEAQSALQEYVKQFQVAQKALEGTLFGMFASLVTVKFQPRAGTIDGTPIDALRIVFTSPGPMTAPDPKKTTPPPPAPLTIEGRIAYVGDKMLVVASNAAREEMTALLARVKMGKAGFAASARFKALQGNLPTGARGYASFSTVDLSRTAIMLFAKDKEKTDALKWLSTLPPQRTVISTYQEVRDGRLHSEVRIPTEQRDFLYQLLKMAQLAKSGTASALPGGNVK